MPWTTRSTTTTTTTTTTARTTTRYWWHPSTTNRPNRPNRPNFTTKRPNLWQQKPFPFEPEVIEAKAKSSNSDSSINSNLISPAYDVVLKFKRFFGMVDKPKDDFIVIEDNYTPEIIEAV